MPAPLPLHRTRPVALLALAAALTLGACGSPADDPGDERAPTSSTTQESPTSSDDTDPTSADAGATTEAPSADDPSDDGDSATVTLGEDDLVTPTDKPQPTQLPGAGGALPTGPVPDEILEREDVQKALADLASQESLTPSEVTVVGFFDVTWNDGSIGCPQEGMMYTQALVPGHLLVLSDGSQLYSYHAAEGKDFAYCADPTLPADLPTTS